MLTVVGFGAKRRLYGPCPTVSDSPGQGCDVPGAARKPERPCLGSVEGARAAAMAAAVTGSDRAHQTCVSDALASTLNE